ncbi:MAG: hypothetical protein GC129_02105 [Proteobacteria bacterium]|nr:hypothetical protein [Pseudomonadota bacterium]
MNNHVLHFLALATVLSACAPTEEYTPAHEKVKTRFQSAAEPAAKDAIWTSPSIFKVAVLNNRTNRDGYAQYVCEVLDEEGFKGKGVWVQVVDIASVVKGGQWTKLGEAHCP